MSKKGEEKHEDPRLATIHTLANSLTIVQLSLSMIDKTVGHLLGEEGKIDFKTAEVELEKAARLLNSLREMCRPAKELAVKP